MRVEILAIGKIKSGPERALIDDYLQRVRHSGRNLGWSDVSEHELTPKKSGPSAESDALLATMTPGGVCIALDERGRSFSSAGFAALMADLRHDNRSAVSFLVGGADGHTEALRRKADLLVALGPQTWPHKLARVMLIEQIYRASTILSGHPYHRD